MILQFSDTANKQGIVQVIERRTGTQSTSTSGYPIQAKTVDTNMALARYFVLANDKAGTWSPADDTNHADYPIVFANINSGQQDYSFTVDEDGNQIQDIYKIRVKDASGNWSTLYPLDLQSKDDQYLNSTTTTSKPTGFRLTANGIMLTDIPNYDSENGLEIFVSRAPAYFVYTDTTKIAGIPEMHQEYLTLRPSYFYCLEKGLPQASAYKLELFGPDGKSGMELDIKNYWSKRNRTEKPGLRVARQNNK